MLFVISFLLLGERFNFVGVVIYLIVLLMILVLILNNKLLSVEINVIWFRLCLVFWLMVFKVGFDSGIWLDEIFFLVDIWVFFKC